MEREGEEPWLGVRNDVWFEEAQGEDVEALDGRQGTVTSRFYVKARSPTDHAVVWARRMVMAWTLD